ncbi:serpin family protein [Rubinisphaera margarita]|uniref:serpin family protein n=1 Tax=Rubinisphaera margarita TaxID=2909586 RepID=UPI001EE88833|nr:serpin family protein [Rubinisphaera margarita]MCG6157480.1 hypothetical protein [Rubinisphaera margarita]
MERIQIPCLVVLLALGCSKNPEVDEATVKQNLKQIGLALQNYRETYREQPSGEQTARRHVLIADAEYYKDGPQQSRPADGTIPAGERVEILENAGSYVLVLSDSGIEGYVSAEALSEQTGLIDDTVHVVEGSNQFALDLYSQLASEDGNLFYSPGSISLALAMTYAGAAGETQTEMAETLHFPKDAEQLHQGMQVLQEFWRQPSKQTGVELRIANRLWGQENYEFLPEFQTVTRTNYGAELVELDFTKADTARQRINEWVAKQTEKKITELIPQGGLSPSAKLVLTNAVYFLGNWDSPFKADRTKKEPFHVAAEEKIDVDMMFQADSFQYGENDLLQVLELPYAERNFSMFVFLPRKVDGLSKLEEQLTAENVRTWIEEVYRENEVQVHLPKFKTTSQFELGTILQQMGMSTAFKAEAADFTGMTGGRDLFISAVHHKAFVDVNEKGTEAAAATGVVMAPTSAPIEPEEPKVFRADHPFVFAIRDNRTGMLLFVGRIINPLK